MQQLVQPILSTSPEYGHYTTDVLNWYRFIELVKNEEDNFAGEQEDTILNVTRLRKIFYDRLGWNTQLIKQRANITGRYKTAIIDCPPYSVTQTSVIKKIKRNKTRDYTTKCRQVTYRETDRQYNPKIPLQIPEIYIRNHQDNLLPEGYYCDIGHVLAGWDALNFPQVISPLPDWLLFAYKIFPYAESNADVATWLGDIATSGADFLIEYLNKSKHPLCLKKEQEFININATASDMLGDIDAYVIYDYCRNGAFSKKRVSEILNDYYADDPDGATYREKRFEIFCSYIGLTGWDGKNFANEQQWLKRYKKQLRNTLCFMLYCSSNNKREKYWRPFLVWLRWYEKVIKLDMLLQLFLDAIKKNY